MVCIFCLRETNENVSLYGSSELAKHARNVVTKHFWFNINEINTARKYACSHCWAEVESFYDFYEMVESNYQNMLNVIDAPKDVVNPSLHVDPGTFCNETAVVKVESDAPDSGSADYEPEQVACLSNFVDVKVEIDETAGEPRDNSNAMSAINYPNESKKKGASNIPIAPSTAQEHRKTGKFTCKVCHKQYSKAGLRYHMAVHDPDDSFILECDLCNKKFSRKSILLNHLKAHQRWKDLDKTKLHGTCPICKKVMSRNNVRIHVLRMHENKRSIKYVCEVCGKGFSSPSLLAQHAIAHIDKAAIQVQCDICGKWQKTEKSLNKHKKSHTQAPLKCSYCDKLVFNSNEMKTHVSQFHAKHKHQCSICEKAFIRPIRLREHIASAHTGERAYKCLYCAKAFKTNSVRFRHMQELHPREYNLDREKRTSK